MIDRDDGWSWSVMLGVWRHLSQCSLVHLRWICWQLSKYNALLYCLSFSTIAWFFLIFQCVKIKISIGCAIVLIFSLRPSADDLQGRSLKTPWIFFIFFLVRSMQLIVRYEPTDYPIGDGRAAQFHRFYVTLSLGGIHSARMHPTNSSALSWIPTANRGPVKSGWRRRPDS